MLEPKCDWTTQTFAAGHICLVKITLFKLPGYCDIISVLSSQYLCSI